MAKRILLDLSEHVMTRGQRQRQREEEKEWDEFMRRQANALQEEHSMYFAKRRPIMPDLREEHVMTRSQRHREGGQLCGVAYGVDNRLWDEEIKKDKEFAHRWFGKMQKNDFKHPGTMRTIEEGNYKGWNVYECGTLKEIPNTLKFEGPKLDECHPSHGDFEKMSRIFAEKRVEWFNEGKFNITFRGNSLMLHHYIEMKAKSLVKEEFDARYILFKR